jgi:hypothetical protein
MESRFGLDFNRVRIHTDETAAASARAMRARAYTLGESIVFGRGQYAPATLPGSWLLAHELAHVAQARPGTEGTNVRTVESEASRAATAVLAGKSVHLTQHHDGRHIHLFGEPENVPQITFVAGQGPTSDGFLTSALVYHRTWALAPITVDSLEDIVARLSGSSSVLHRIRIVSHADSPGIFLSLFENGPALTLDAQTLRAWAQSDVAGLEATVGDLLEPTTTAVVLTQLRSTDPSVLRPFGLEAAGMTPAGTVARLIHRSAELLMVRSDPGLTATQRARLTTALMTILADLRAQAQRPPPDGAGVSAAQAQALQDAVTGITTIMFAAMPWTPGHLQEVGAAVTAIAGCFRRRLNRVRARFTRDSWIDLRGCRAGADLDYLRAVSEFFGAAPETPHVSAPDWFQSFPTLGYQTLTDADIATLAGDSDIQRALDHWSPITGIRDYMNRLRIFYQSIIIEDLRSRQQAGTRRPSLAPGLSLPPLQGGLRMPEFGAPSLPELSTIQLSMPEWSQPPIGRSPTLGAGTLTNPIVSFARRELERLDQPDAEIQFYFNAALILPVQSSANVDDIRLFMKHSLRNQAIDNWLDSQWATAAPGLGALKRGAWSAAPARRVAALSKLDAPGTDPDQEMVISPDPRYQAHIRSI